MKSKYNCVFCLTPISKGHFENQNGKCQRCQYRFPDAMPIQKICAEFGCTEYAQIGKEYCTVHELKNKPDMRYNVPKNPHNISDEEIDKAIEENPIYRKVWERKAKTYRDQVGYGLVKYPETFNPDSWTKEELVQHFLQEINDAQNYLEGLETKFLQLLELMEKVK